MKFNKFNIGDIFKYPDEEMDDTYWLIVGLVHDEDGEYYKIIPLDEFNGNTDSGYFYNEVDYTDRNYERVE